MATALFLDLAALAIAVVFAALGAWSGFIREVFRFVALTAGAFISFMFYRDLQGLLTPLSSNEQVVAVTSFLAVFFVAFFAIMGASLLLKKVVKTLTLEWLDRLLGMTLGLLKAAVIVWAACLSISSVQVQAFQEKFAPSVVYRGFRAMPKFMTLESLEKAKSAIRGNKKDIKEDEDSGKNIDNTTIDI